MTLISLAGALHYNDLLESDDTSVVKILNWLCANLGQLNDLIATNYVIVGNDASPELGLDEAAIFGTLYLKSYYQRRVQSNLGASAYSVLEVREADSVVRLQNKNELAKTYLQLKNQLNDQLNEMARLYRKWRCVPSSFSGPFTCGVFKKID